MEVADKARQMLEEAVRIRASDIFFLPKKGSYKLRLRAGDLEERPSLTREAGNELINWFKFARRRPKTPVTPHDEDIEDAKIIE